MLTEVEAGCGAGEFRTTDPHEATRAVLVLCQGWPSGTPPAGPKPEQIAAQYIGFALALVEGTMVDPT